MEAKYEHKTESLGASFDTDYRVITQCTPDCPACAFKAGIKKVVEWIRNHISLPHFHQFQDHRLVTDTLINYDAHYTQEEWQAKLKEWGVE